MCYVIARKVNKWIKINDFEKWKTEYLNSKYNNQDQVPVPNFWVHGYLVIIEGSGHLFF